MQQIGRYEVLRKTGSRRLSGLYEAFDPVMNRSVAIELPEGGADPDTAEHARQQILEDAHQLAVLDHPAILKVLGCEEHDASPVLVIEAFSDRTLRTLLVERGKLTPAEVEVLIQAAAGALDFAHSKGLLHPHFTPDSIRVNDELGVKIAGFEAARPGGSEPDDAELPAAGEWIPYMAPEFVLGTETDRRTDQYSLAAVAFEALTGAPLFHDASPLQLLCQAGFEQPEIRAGLAGLPPRVVSVFEKALSKDLSGRYATCAEFASAVSNALSGKAAPEAEETRREPSRSPAKTSHRFGWVVMGIAAVALIVIAWLAFASRSEVAGTGAPAPPQTSTPREKQLADIVSSPSQKSSPSLTVDKPAEQKVEKPARPRPARAAKKTEPEKPAEMPRMRDPKVIR